MKKTFWKQIGLILVLGFGVFAVMEIWKAWSAGKRAIADLLLAPWTALKAGWTTASNAVANSTPVQGIVALGQLPGLEQKQQQDAIAQTAVADSYQPGGAMYNKILASQGQTAADAAASQAAQNAANQTAQATADSSWSTSPWNPLTWF